MTMLKRLLVALGLAGFLLAAGVTAASAGTNPGYSHYPSGGVHGTHLGGNPLPGGAVHGTNLDPKCGCHHVPKSKPPGGWPCKATNTCHPHKPPVCKPPHHVWHPKPKPPVVTPPTKPPAPVYHAHPLKPLLTPPASPPVTQLAFTGNHYDLPAYGAAIAFMFLSGGLLLGFIKPKPSRK